MNVCIGLNLWNKRHHTETFRKGYDYKKKRIHSTTAKAIFKLDSETWVLKKIDEQRLEAAQMKFLRYLLGINKSGQERNQSVREKPRVLNTVLEIQQYQRKWLQYPQRMDISKIQKRALNYKQKTRRSIRRQKEKWKNKFHFEGY